MAWGDHPDRCAYGHSWATGSGNLIVGWLPCVACVPGELGHLRVKCIAKGEDGTPCRSTWHDPPHTPGAEIRGRTAAS